MSRAIYSLVLGAVTGAVAVYIFDRRDPGTDSDSFPAGRAPASISQLAGPSPGQGAARIPGDTTAVLGFDPSAQDSIFERAAADPETVLAELAALSPPARRRDVALAVLESLGNNDAAISRVAATLPAPERMSFRIDALAARAVTDPVSALQSALWLDVGAARELAIPRIAEAVAGSDPSRALALASLIENAELNTLYLANVAGTWATVDGPAALAWLEVAVPSELSAAAAADALDAIAESDPDALLANLDSFSAALRPAARKSAIVALAARDPNAAVARIELLGAGQERSDIESAIAGILALEDPEAAVEWAKGTNSETVLEEALRSAALVDYDLAVDLALRSLETEPIWPAFALVESGHGDFSLFADALLASNVPDREQHFESLMVRWPQVDAQASLEWALANAGQLQQGWLWRLSLDGAREYPDLAIALLDRVPPDLRGDWIAGVAGGMAAADPDRALAFLGQHGGESGYDEGLALVVDSMAESDPVAAARVVETTGARAAGRVGWAWAQQDPDAAASWVAGLEDPEMRRDGISNLAANWSRTEPDAAIEWLLGLPQDLARDSGLSSALQIASAAAGTIDRQLLEAIGDEGIRERAALNAIVMVGRNDADEARRLVGELIEDDRQRQEALREIAEQVGGSGWAGFASGSIDVPR